MLITVRGWAPVPALSLAVFDGLLLGGIAADLVGSPIGFPLGCLLGIPVSHLFGVLVNSRRRPDGDFWRARSWHNSHAINNVPVQALAVVPLLWAIPASLWAMAQTRPRLGVVSYLVPAATIVLGIGYFAIIWALTSRRPRTRRPKPESASLDITKTITLSRTKAAAGFTTTIRYRARQLCRRCSGAGYRSGVARRCRRCRGRGLRRRARTKVTVRIPPGVAPGKWIRVAGKGTPAHRSQPAGDLFLLVRVSGRAPRAARR